MTNIRRRCGAGASGHRARDMDRRGGGIAVAFALAIAGCAGRGDLADAPGTVSRASAFPADLPAPGSAASSGEGEPHRPLLPDRHDPAQARERGWIRDDGGRMSTPEWAEGGGTRVAAIVQDGDEDRPEALLLARGVDGHDRTGAWVQARETFRQGGRRMLVADLDGRWAGAQVRLSEGDHARLRDVAWRFLDPPWPDAGELARSAAPAEPASVLHPALYDVGVVDRETWGARPTACTSPEDDWYRMAIHHTAGTQEYGGSVEGAVQWLQVYAQDSGEYCDIPYQFLVGHDGSLWEGRPLSYYSGATGGGNNDGNIAACFLGCYHPSDCPTAGGDEVTEEMIDGGRHLVQALAALHDFVTDSDTIRGHRDWPGNATACPGDRVDARLDDLRSPLPVYGGSLVGHGFPDGGTGIVSLQPGTFVDGWVDVLNTGAATWQPGATNLATLPRDEGHPLADPTWISPTRPATVAASTAPGEVGRFAFRIAGSVEGTTGISFAVVQEWVSWFADPPLGGGPADAFLALEVHVADASGDDDTAPPDDDTAPPDDDAAPPDDNPGDDDSAADRVEPLPLERHEAHGCGCSGGAPTDPPVAWGVLAAAAVSAFRRTTRAVPAQPPGPRAAMPTT